MGDVVFDGFACRLPSMQLLRTAFEEVAQCNARVGLPETGVWPDFPICPTGIGFEAFPPLCGGSTQTDLVTYGLWST